MLRNRYNGMSLMWAVVVLVGLTAIASLAVDLGRVALAKTQLRAAADAAALAAGQHVLSDPAVARAAAIDVATRNLADGAPVVLNSSDIEVGYWNKETRLFTANATPRNAVRVTARRTSARGNPIDLPFAQMIGAFTCDVEASAVAMTTPRRYAAIGLDFITMGGNTTNAYRSTNTPMPANGEFSSNGDIASNGDITLTGSSLVDGNALPGVGRRVIGANHVSGSTAPLSSPLVYPVEDPGSAATINDNACVPSFAIKAGSIDLGNQKSVSLPGGVYYFKNLNMGAGAMLEFTGPATLYLTGNLSLGGHAVTNKNLPHNLRIVMLTPGSTALLNGGSDLFADIYAPLTAITISGNGDIYGSIVGKSIAMSGNGQIHYDLTLAGGVTLVK